MHAAEACCKILKSVSIFLGCADQEEIIS